MSMHGKADTKQYYALNATEKEIEGEGDDGSVEDEKTSSKRRCLMISLLVFVFTAAIIALILVLALKGSNGSENKIPKGINGYTIIEELSTKSTYEAFLERIREVEYPIKIDEESNPEVKNLYMKVSMMNDQTYRVKLNPLNQNATLCKDESLDE